MRAWRLSLFAFFGLFLGGCTFLEIGNLVPANVVSATGLPPELQVCAPPGSSQATLFAARHAQQLDALENNILRFQAGLPGELANDPVVSTVLAHIRYASTNARVSARAILSGQMSADDATRLAAAAKPRPLNPGDFATFAHNISEHALRHTPSSGDTNIQQSPFLLHLRAYYQDYFDGNFVTYFSAPLAKPQLSTTITDTEISQAASVFLELVFDELLQPTVWIDDKGTYYPGAVVSKTPPTYLTVNKLKAALLTTGLGCGMTLQKAVALNYLATTFATAAKGESGLVIRSAGGLEIGLGILGKLNIGDNSTLTSLLQMAVTEAVQRLTVAIGAPILESIEITQPQQATTAALVRSAKLQKAQMIRSYSAAFISAGGMR